MFKECGLIEKYGSGIDKIKRLCKAHGIKQPKFEELQKGFRVILYKATAQEKADKGINALYEYIKNNSGETVSQMKERLNTPSKTLEKWIKQPRDQSKIEYRGSKKTGGYYTNKSANIAIKVENPSKNTLSIMKRNQSVIKP
ncbi:MAG: ATP-binding protein [Methyloprofundus sp.]|nr:ATP-binding protein [Methyloprofundus sp.]